MTTDLKALWDALEAKRKNSPGPLDPEVIEGIDIIMAAINALRKTFENERNHQPFISQAPCPICGGTVTYQYQAPLIGSMKCDTPECFSLNF
jgi:hypothetical protein